MSAPEFSYSQHQLRQFAADVLRHARELGASACETDVSEAFGQSVSVRKDAVDTIEYNRDKGIGVTVYLGQQRGHASTSDFSPAALRATVAAALSIARFTAPDPCAGLPEEKLLARKSMDLDLHHPWPLSVEEAIETARRCEQAAFAVSPLVRNSEGASVSVQQSQFVSANSLGFMGGFPTSRHYISCSVIAGAGDNMQRDDWYTSNRNPARLAAPEAVGEYAARRALARLGARRLKTRAVPVLFEAPLAVGLIGSLVQAVSGGALYRKSSFLLDSLGQQIFPQHVQISERPHLKGALASSPFDDDGVATRDREVVQDGVLQGYFLSTYSARKLDMQTTGNAGGSHNLIVKSGALDFEGLLRQMDTGLLVTELLGQGVNYVTGDYSRGAAGYWVEKGRIAYPVQEITIAGNLREMFKGIVAIGNDVLVRGSKQVGSILIDRMTVAGN
ncbi:peptidase required for the maturation and secretion of the antibiotic peptide MccB17 [Sterolibacterium denitrificans]|uniref:Peptidase required for the maturation and secretion of the antibiotic peptide MccB17 n=1 Tax=Sterolibacterium denitrificans TaxID=157592 RepID=A0A7Z7HQ05_9PROT|nr:metalloprotease PmbA [Sterolibacterium denitrificans]SMB23976.1 peptidase required for the maturation and secretion of the antibiotic peptide MccB17 [Sterolibacterium denitrificans]